MVTALDVNSAETSTVHAEEPAEYYYYYNGHTGYNHDGDCTVDELFMKGLSDNNFQLNGYRVDADPDANTDGEVYRADFPVADAIIPLYATIAQIKDVYGEKEVSILWYGDGAYYYFVSDAQIAFTFDGGLVDYVQIDAMELVEEK